MASSALRGLDLSRCSFLVLTSAGEAFGRAELLDFVDGDPTMQDEIVVQPAPGRANNIFRPEDAEIYHARVLTNAKMFIEFLLKTGIESEAIQHVDFSTQNPTDPEKTLRAFLETLPAERPDAVIYFSGHATKNGEWFFGWRQKLAACRSSLTPWDFDINLAGERYIISDAPGTATSWLSPSLRVRGLAAWRCELCPAADMEGSQLTHFLCEKRVDMPQGALALEPPQDVGLRRLPCYEPLLWAANLPNHESHQVTSGATPLMESLWQLESFTRTGSNESRALANTEFLLRGGPIIILKVMQSHSMDDTVCLSCIQILRSMVDHAPRRRWFQRAEETLTQVLQILESRESPLDATLLTQVLGLVSAFSESFASCQQICADEHWRMISPLITDAITGDKGESCCLAGCALMARLATQPIFESFMAGGTGRRGAAVGVVKGNTRSSVQTQKVLDTYDRTLEVQAKAAKLVAKRLEDETGNKLLNQLIALIGKGGKRSAASSEALLFLVLNREMLKRRVLSGMQTAKAYDVLLKDRSANVCSQLLALLRAVGSADFEIGVAVGIPAKAAHGIVSSMCRFPDDAEVQRWGCAALGALCSSCPDLRKPASEGAPMCILWALGAKAYTHNEAVHQEAAFCANILLRAQDGHAVFGDSLVDLSRLSALAADRSLRNKGEGSSAVVVWAMRVLEQICYAPNGFWKVIAHAPVVVRALLHPDCTLGTINAGVAIISSLAVHYDPWMEQLKPHYESVSRMLQLRAWKVKALDTDVGREEEVALRNWCEVLYETFNPGEEEEQTDSDSDDGYDSKLGSRRGSKDIHSRRGSKDST